MLQNFQKLQDFPKAERPKYLVNTTDYIVCKNICKAMSPSQFSFFGMPWWNLQKSPTSILNDHNIYTNQSALKSSTKKAVKAQKWV